MRVPGADRNLLFVGSIVLSATRMSHASSIISFFNAGPAGDATGSKVYNGSGTILPQTTI